MSRKEYMKQYHKIQTIFKRDMEHGAKIMIGSYSEPELEYLANNQWVFTEKVDGTNIRVMWDGANVTFGGKTDDAQMPVFLLYRLQEMFEGTVKRQLFKETFNNPDSEPGSVSVCLYGEGYGAKIQKGGVNYKKDGVDFVLFDVKIDDTWLERANVEDIAKKLGIQVVPIVGEGTLNDAMELVKNGMKSTWGEFLSEGIVARPKTELLNRRGHRIITKIKHRDFI